MPEKTDPSQRHLPRTGEPGPVSAKPRAPDRTDAGWFGNPRLWNWRARALQSGTRALIAIERAFIKPTHRKGDDRDPR